MSNTSTDLTGKLLIAMPGLRDTRFERSVIFICAHEPDAVLGLIINKPLASLSFGGLLEQLDIPDTRAQDGLVHYGGPVESERGFVLHSLDYADEDATMNINGAFGMTATLEILHDMGAGRGPNRVMVMLGYAGWSGGQLEQEIVQNGWLVTEATTELVFGANDPGKWKAALGSLGINPLMLSGHGGTA